MSSRASQFADGPLAEDHETFRNELASVAQDGRRRWIYARQPKGRFYRARTIVSIFLVGFLILAPFVTVGGQPLMLLDVLHRQFVILGVIFRPQDFAIVVVLALTALVTLVLSTVVVGRVWCGWLCPQTIFMEMVFRRLEYWIDGSAEQQVRRSRKPWTRSRVARAGLKHGIFAVLSFAIANVFLAWIIGAQELWTIVTDPPAKHLAGLAAITIFSGVFYLVFARFREQACVLACPYGRVMSALIDRQTVTVTYDTRRGEPRGRLAKVLPSGARAAGDCIDCHQCVTVCPTGIDIRDGIQLECVNCTACVDACDGVMDRVGRPKGLIRLTSHQAVNGGTSRWISGRAAAYGAVWLVLVGTLATLIVQRPDLDVLILRQPGTLYTTIGQNDVANFYDIQALNRTSRRLPFVVEVLEPAGGRVTTLGVFNEVEPYGLLESRLLLQLPASALAGPSTPVRFAVRTSDGAVHTIDSAFLGPAPERPTSERTR